MHENKWKLEGLKVPFVAFENFNACQLVPMCIQACWGSFPRATKADELAAANKLDDAIARALAEAAEGIGREE